VISLDKVKQRLLEGEQIEEIVQKMNWKEFEKLIAEILRKHDFNIHSNFRFKTDRRFEIDVLAVKNKISFLIDCKQWGRGRYKKTGLKYAAKDQKHRLNELKKFLRNNLAAKIKLKVNKNTNFIPLIITWFEEDITLHDKVFIVPIWKFNEFLLSMSEYI